MKTTKTSIKKVALLLFSAVLTLSLSGVLLACSGEPAGTPAAKGAETLSVGASPAPHQEILDLVKEDLASEGVELQILTYTDYVKPNNDTQNGDIKANFFQHKPYLDEFNEKNGTDLVSVAAIHFEPLAIHPGISSSLTDLPDGATVAVPNDTTNEARALHLLAAQGIITLPTDADLTITPRDIVENPKNLKFSELEAATIPASLPDVDIAVINGNYALSSNLDLTKILASEDVDSQAAQTYANIIVVKAGNENDPQVQVLVKALTSDKVRQFIEENYKGTVVPVF